MTSDHAGAAGAAVSEPTSYPAEVALKDGRGVTLRLMGPQDAEELHRFFCGIPPEDLLFLRRNVTDRAVIDQWAERVARGAVYTVLAQQDGRVVGEASLHLNSITWTEHVGEIRVVLAPGFRGSGLGTRLTQEIFLLALQQGIVKIIAEMTIEQKGALAVFQKLGFRVEGLLRNHVRDRAGKPHDLVLMGHETREFYDQMRAYGYEETLST
ncbi:MAG TPA: GNAT family protein [Dehalococcoidia bacterium]|nr:GNAT family protein [Dehalococcoidia bacterium]